MRSEITTKEAERTHIIKRVEDLRGEIVAGEESLEKDALDAESAKKKLEYETSRAEELERDI